MISISHYYRNSGFRAVLALLLLMLPAVSGRAQVLKDNTQRQQDQQASPSQTSRKKTKRGPRAIAVLEFLPGGGARLIPVALWINDRFYDASLYGANPAPMALEPETVYEATYYGESTGLFTVSQPEEVKGNWIGNGQWKPQNTFDQKATEQAAKQPKPKPKSFNVDEDRPVLHRAGSGSAGSAPARAPGNSGATPAGTSASRSSPPPNEPPDRPTLKKTEPPVESSTAQAGAASPPPQTSSPDENDPNRPVLRRGKPQTETAAADAAVPPAPAKSASSTTKIGKSYPAVSDAAPYQTRSLLYAMNSNERAEESGQMCALALAQVHDFIAKRKTPGLPKDAVISDYDLRAYDLDYSNSPTLVLTATLPVAGSKSLRGGDFAYFVTVVAHEDINGAPIKIFASVSDSNHLDAFPRMEIIDAVDADANGRGDLLFRQYSDIGVNYSLFRVYPYDMQKVFEGGSAM